VSGGNFERTAIRGVILYLPLVSLHVKAKTLNHRQVQLSKLWLKSISFAELDIVHFHPLLPVEGKKEILDISEEVWSFYMQYFHKICPLDSSTTQPIFVLIYQVYHFNINACHSRTVILLWLRISFFIKFVFGHFLLTFIKELYSSLLHQSNYHYSPVHLSIQDPTAENTLMHTL
jgi:hypothetical protein